MIYVNEQNKINEDDWKLEVKKDLNKNCDK